jgi:hypothetical protein
LISTLSVFMHYNIHYHYSMFKETLISYIFSRTLESQHRGFFNYPLLTINQGGKVRKNTLINNFEFKLKSFYQFLLQLFFLFITHTCLSSSSPPIKLPNFSLYCFAFHKPICKLQSHNLKRFLK